MPFSICTGRERANMYEYDDLTDWVIGIKVCHLFPASSKRNSAARRPVRVATGDLHL